MTLQQLIVKYTDRYDTDDKKLHEDITEYQTTDDAERRVWLNSDMQYLNAELGVYECIIKDLKNLEKEIEK